MRSWAAIGIGAFFALATAHAADRDGSAVAPAPNPWPSELVGRSATLPRGMLEIFAPLGLNLTNDRVANPVFLAPSVSYGVTDDFMVGLRHFLGLCLSGTTGGCPDVYNDVSVEATWRAWRGHGAELAVGAAVDFSPLDPFLVSFEVRTLARWTGGPFAFVLAPSLDIGITDRDTTAEKRLPIPFSLATYSFGWFQQMPGNREILTVPATIQIQIFPPLAAAAGAAILVPLDPPGGNPGDFYTFPVGFALLVTPDRPFDVGASVTFANLLGAEGWPGTQRGESRVAQLFGAFRL